MTDYTDLSRKQLVQKIEQLVKALDKVMDQRDLLASMTVCPECRAFNVLEGRGHGLECKACHWKLGVDH